MVKHSISERGMITVGKSKYLGWTDCNRQVTERTLWADNPEDVTCVRCVKYQTVDVQRGKFTNE